MKTYRQSTRFVPLWTAVLAALVLLAFTPAARAQDFCNDPDESPDVIVGDLVGRTRHGVVGDITAFSVGTTSCNLGNCVLNWISNIPEHPVIGQNMYRLKNGRFEQIGQSWLKHGFTALQGSVCSASCVQSPSGSYLGVLCSDPYSSGLNGQQNRLGPKFEVNAYSGVYPYPPTNGSMTGNAIYKRLQVHNADLDPTLNASSRYFVEGQYISHDDSTAGNNKNNASWREITVSGTNPTFDITLIGTTQREQSMIAAWKALDPSVTQTNFSVSGDGTIFLSAKATPLGGGNYHYEYAVQNVNSNRAGQSFTVPIPYDAIITNVGFHDVDYHSGEPYVGTDWTATIGPTSITWASETFAQNQNANALRWGTLYNFRFDANVAPSTYLVTLGLFRPGAPTEVVATTVVPTLCNINGICNPGENCSNCGSDCTNQGGGGGCCGNATCEGGENPCRCATDCGAQAPSEAACGNAIDEDCDGLTDCLDGDCCQSASCTAFDQDGDAYAAVCDCDDSNGVAWATPGEVRNVMITKSGPASATLTWEAPLQPGGSANEYDTIRSANPNDFVTEGVCVPTKDPTLPTITDSDMPAPGVNHSYLIRATNACPNGQGSVGTTSGGQPRIARTCP